MKRKTSNQVLCDKKSFKKTLIFMPELVDQMTSLKLSGKKSVHQRKMSSKVTGFSLMSCVKQQNKNKKFNFLDKPYTQ
jgi:hypothetical protein